MCLLSSFRRIFVKMKGTDEKFVKMISERLRQLRRERGYTQEYVIEHTHLDISRYESGTSVPSLLSVVKLCKVFGLTLREFFADMDYPES